MAYLDRREPAVYVDIEDKSYAAETIETGRSVYSVILCDRGPSNQIVKVRSQAQFHDVFGTPNFLRTSQTHYQMDAALQYTSNGLVVRVVPDDAYWANAVIKKSGGSEKVTARFVFTNKNDVTEEDLDKARKVEMYALDSTSAVHGSEIYGDSTDFEKEVNKVQIGCWIYAEGDNSSVAAQIVNMEQNEETGATILYLDREYEGSSSDGVAYISNAPYEISSLADVNSEKAFIDGGDVVYYFYAVGAGKFYNRICIRGTRNTDLEKYYLDENDQPRYKYLFMNIGIYELQDNGNMKLLEGPWVVSLAPRYPDDGNNSANGQVIDPTTGNYIFIEEVINDNSNLVRCVATTKDPVTDEPNAEFPCVTQLVDDEDKRLQVMLLLSTYTPVGTQNIALSTTGVRLSNGTDGTGQYNSSDNIQPSDTLLAKVARAFGGQLTENGIDELRETVYPVFQPDYIVCGGYPAFVQYAANELASYRQDCMVLADTGAFHNNGDDDLDARLHDVPWNTFTSMLYTQFRRITDTYTGRKFWVSPVYHAIKRHLYCDAVYFLAEPVAGIEKGAIEEPCVLAYKGNHTLRGDLMDVELNCTIEEPDGIYFLTQFTTWKRYSVLKRAHVAKFVLYLKKALPPILKDILQRRATSYWISQARTRVNSFMAQFLEGPTERYSCITSFNANVSFDATSSTLDVILSIVPIRAIERINVTISVS